MARGEVIPAAAVLAGGGIDSTTCMYQLRADGARLRAIHVNFGQPASDLEWSSVRRIAGDLRVDAAQIQVVGGRTHRGDEVPGRNAALAFLALMHLLPHERLICLGIHAGTPFVDCSKPFLASLDRLIAEQTDSRVRLIAPLIDLDKPEVVKLARSLRVPLAMTYSCQKGVVGGCGSCHSCLDRKAIGC